MMMASDEQELQQTVTILKALGEPNRLRIFAELMRGDSCNQELQENLELTPNLLSHHLRVLNKAGLITSRRDKIDGRWIYYSVNRETAARWQTWFDYFLDPSRIQKRALCGPEGQLITLDQVAVSGAP